MWHMNSQHSCGHPGKVWKQLENFISRAARKESISPHLFLHFYVFENCMDSPRFCKHCSKCSRVSHCKNPCSDLKVYIHKKKGQSYLDIIISDNFFIKILRKKISEELDKIWYLVIFHSLLTCFIYSSIHPSLTETNLDAELTISFIYKPINLLKYSAFLFLLCSLQIEERTSGEIQDTDYKKHSESWY